MTDNTPAHYPLSPSASSRWLKCPGSIELSRGRENEESTYAREGTAAHRIAAEMLAGNPVEPPRLCNRCNAEITDLPPCHVCGSSEFRIDKDMVEILRKTYVAYVQTLREQNDFLDEAIETKIESRTIADFGGTIDYKAIYRDGILGGVVLHIVDLKYGAGVPVSAQDNKQMLSYLALAKEHHPNVEHFRVTIVQPRCGDGKPDTVEVSGADLSDHMLAIGAAVQSTTLCPGDHCRWCPAKSDCPALKDQALEVARLAFSVDPVTVATGSEDFDVLLEMFEKRKAIVDFFEGIEKRLIGELEKGGHVPGYKAVRRWGNRAWCIDEEEAIKKIAGRKDGEGNRIGKKAIVETKLKSVAALERLGLKDAIADLITRSEIGYKLVPESDKGEAVIFASVDEMFADPPVMSAPVPSLDDLLG